MKKEAFHPACPDGPQLSAEQGRNLAAVTAIILTSMMFTTLFTLAQGMARTMTEMYLRQAGTGPCLRKADHRLEIASLAAQLRW